MFVRRKAPRIRLEKLHADLMPAPPDGDSGTSLLSGTYRNWSFQAIYFCTQVNAKREQYEENRPIENDPHPVCILCRSEEHTSELQSLRHLVCRLLLEKKK